MIDIVSRHNFKKLVDLGFQDQISSLQHSSSESKMSILRQKLHIYFKMPLHLQQDMNMTPYNSHTNLTIDRMDTFSFISLSSKSSRTDSPKLYIKSNSQWSRHTSRHSAQSIIKI